MNYNEKFRQIRESKGMSLREAARLANVQPIQLSHIERGMISPRLATVIKLCNAYEITLTELFK